MKFAVLSSFVCDFFFILLFKSKEKELVAEKTAYRIDWLFRVVILLGGDEVIEHSRNQQAAILDSSINNSTGLIFIGLSSTFGRKGGFCLSYLFQEEYQEFSNFIFKSGI